MNDHVLGSIAKNIIELSTKLNQMCVGLGPWQADTRYLTDSNSNASPAMKETAKRILELFESVSFETKEQLEVFAGSLWQFKEGDTPRRCITYVNGVVEFLEEHFCLELKDWYSKISHFRIENTDLNKVKNHDQV